MTALVLHPRSAWTGVVATNLPDVTGPDQPGRLSAERALQILKTLSRQRQLAFPRRQLTLQIDDTSLQPVGTVRQGLHEHHRIRGAVTDHHLQLMFHQSGDPSPHRDVHRMQYRFHVDHTASDTGTFTNCTPPE